MQQVRDRIHVPSWVPKGLSHGSHAVLGGLHTELLFAFGYTFQVGFLSNPSCLHRGCNALCYILTFSKITFPKKGADLRPFSCLAAGLLV